MGKREKELTNSYFHARNAAFANKRTYHYDIEGYELLYMIKNGIEVPDKVDGVAMSQILNYDPKLIHDPVLKEYVGRMNKNNYVNVISKNPELLEKAPKDIQKEIHEYGDGIVTILKYQPQMIDKFNVDTFTSGNISSIIRDQPELINKFDIGKLKSSAIGWILMDQPTLIMHFLEAGKIYEVGREKVAELMSREYVDRKQYSPHAEEIAKNAMKIYKYLEGLSDEEMVDLIKYDSMWAHTLHIVVLQI